MSYFSIKLPKILYLALFVSRHTKKIGYYNTNDLANDANQIASDLVRQRKDKKDYKFLEDTNFGGLRGNFSTVLTLRGYVKRGSRYTGWYGIGKDDRLLNAVIKGDIVLDKTSLTAHTSSLGLSKLLEQESKLLNVRESQAHIGAYLEKNNLCDLTRDTRNFPKESVVKSPNNIFFLRILFNNYLSLSKDVIEYNMLNYWQGSKYKRHNIHALFVLPLEDDPWGGFFAISSDELYKHKPLFVYYDVKRKVFEDKDGNSYQHRSLDEAVNTFTSEHENIDIRLAYSWKNEKENFSVGEVSATSSDKKTEFFVFLSDFLQWRKGFSIDGKEVVELKEISSGGPDVELTYSGGTTQKLELEHVWANYLAHGHHKSNAWADVWLYANEAWDFEHIKRIFTPHLANDSSRIPSVFLCTDKVTGDKKAYTVNWESLSYTSVIVD